jgi:hypothetical protein
MERLWQRMAEIYGHRWTSSYGVEPADTWARALAHVDGEGMARALQACIDRAGQRAERGEEDWPPTLGEFVAMTKPPKRAPYHRDYVPLPAPERKQVTRELSAEEIARVEWARSILRGEQ